MTKAKWVERWVALSDALEKRSREALNGIDVGPRRLSYVEFRLLRRVAQSGATSTGQLARDFATDVANCSRVVSLLTKDGFLKNNKDVESGRTNVVTLTDLGRELSDACEAALADCDIAVFRGVSRADLAVLLSKLEAKLETSSRLTLPRRKRRLS